MDQNIDFSTQGTEKLDICIKKIIMMKFTSDYIDLIPKTKVIFLLKI